MKSLGERLVWAREVRGLSQVELAQKLEKTYQQVSAWERNENGMRAPNLRAVADALQVDPHWLKTGEGSMYPSPLESYARSVPGDNRDSMVCEPADASYALKPPDPLDAALLQRAIQEALAFAPNELPERLAQAITDAYNTALRTRRLDKVGELVRTFLS